jgi:hypothetical protein
LEVEVACSGSGSSFEGPTSARSLGVGDGVSLATGTLGVDRDTGGVTLAAETVGSVVREGVGVTKELGSSPLKLGTAGDVGVALGRPRVASGVVKKSGVAGVAQAPSAKAISMPMIPTAMVRVFVLIVVLSFNFDSMSHSRTSVKAALTAAKAS